MSQNFERYYNGDSSDDEATNSARAPGSNSFPVKLDKSSYDIDDYTILNAQSHQTLDVIREMDQKQFDQRFEYLCSAHLAATYNTGNLDNISKLLIYAKERQIPFNFKEVDVQRAFKAYSRGLYVSNEVGKHRWLSLISFLDTWNIKFEISTSYLKNLTDCEEVPFIIYQYVRQNGTDRNFPTEKQMNKIIRIAITSFNLPQLIFIEKNKDFNIENLWKKIHFYFVGWNRLYTLKSICWLKSQAHNQYKVDSDLLDFLIETCLESKCDFLEFLLQNFDLTSKHFTVKLSDENIKDIFENRTVNKLIENKILHPDSVQKIVYKYFYSRYYPDVISSIAKSNYKVKISSNDIDYLCQHKPYIIWELYENKLISLSDNLIKKWLKELVYQHKIEHLDKLLKYKLIHNIKHSETILKTAWSYKRLDVYDWWIKSGLPVYPILEYFNKFELPRKDYLSRNKIAEVKVWKIAIIMLNHPELSLTKAAYKTYNKFIRLAPIEVQAQLKHFSQYILNSSDTSNSSKLDFGPFIYEAFKYLSHLNLEQEHKYTYHKCWLQKFKTEEDLIELLIDSKKITNSISLGLILSCKYDFQKILKTCLKYRHSIHTIYRAMTEAFVNGNLHLLKYAEEGLKLNFSKKAIQHAADNATCKGDIKMLKYLDDYQYKYKFTDTPIYISILRKNEAYIYALKSNRILDFKFSIGSSYQQISALHNFLVYGREIKIEEISHIDPDLRKWFSLYSENSALRNIELEKKLIVEILDKADEAKCPLGLHGIKPLQKLVADFAVTVIRKNELLQDNEDDNKDKEDKEDKEDKDKNQSNYFIELFNSVLGKNSKKLIK
jgi:hypothetical protein